MDSADAVIPDGELLLRRVNRERRARLEAEALAENGLRELFRRQQELLLIEAVATAANTAPTVEDSMRLALESYCGFAGWMAGHLCMAESDAVDGTLQLIPTGVWHVSDSDRFAPVRHVTESQRFRAGECLPGRVLETGRPVWIQDVRRDPGFSRAHAVSACGLRSAFGLPVLIGSEVAAVLEFFGEEAPAPDDNTFRLAANLGMQLGRVIERKRSADRLIDAYHDPLTHLPNRALLFSDLELAMRRSKRDPDYVFAVLFLDLDRFKVVNDSLGHLAGDRLIVEFGRRISASLRRPDGAKQREGFEDQRPDTVARLGGDEFVVLLDDIRDASDAVRVAERILHKLEAPFELQGHKVPMSASIGIALSATGYSLPEEILRDADSAMYKAKGAGKGRYEVFDPTMHALAMERLQVEADLRTAIDSNELRLHYQPIVSLSDSRIIGFEALVRWQHPRRGLIGPVDFVPIAEETGLIHALGRWTLLEATRQFQRWNVGRRDGNLMMAVNVSGQQLGRPDFVSFISHVLRESGMPPECLWLELTESVAMAHVDRTPALLADLKALNVKIAIDDFGTGFSSLASLHLFPIDAIKIDATFVRRLTSVPASRAIVRAVVAVGAALNLRVVAEGIESDTEVRHLIEVGGSLGQGFHFQPALDAESIDALFPFDRPLRLD